MLDFFKKLNVFKRVEELKVKSEGDRKITQQIFGGLIDAGIQTTEAMEAIDGSLLDVEARISALEKRVELLLDRVNAKPVEKIEGAKFDGKTVLSTVKKANAKTKNVTAKKPTTRKAPTKTAKAK